MDPLTCNVSVLYNNINNNNNNISTPKLIKVAFLASEPLFTFYSRSYAEDVTSVTSGASQGPHSFNLVFVCLCVCLCHAWRYPYLTAKKHRML